MRILCSFPGRYGDLLWSLPICRAISEAAGEPVDLLIAGEFAGMVPILKAPYLGQVYVDPQWSLTPPREWQPPDHTRGEWQAIFGADLDRFILPSIDLGFRGWPDQPLPQFIYAQTKRGYPDLPMAPLSLEPWLAAEGWPQCRADVAIGFTECHFELKFGLCRLLFPQSWHDEPSSQILCPEGRWTTEGHEGATGWDAAAKWIATATVFLGDCSALHVLAVALGVPVILYEPMDARLNSIFLPFGMGEQPGDRVFVVRGNDFKPTTDARHTADAIRAALERVK